MSNKNLSSTENLCAVRWRMHLPNEICDVILSLAVGEERDPGAILARWVKDYYRSRYSTDKERVNEQSG